LEISATLEPEERIVISGFQECCDSLKTVVLSAGNRLVIDGSDSSIVLNQRVGQVVTGFESSGAGRGHTDTD
jgi:hypothetical protein